jgi:hypothetical protein
LSVGISDGSRDDLILTGVGFNVGFGVGFNVGVVVGRGEGIVGISSW